ncbi:MAG: hypothetical protein IJU58_01855 [Clostridia bacterium]|nr:hypothetical protein [Clostridia bacterium]
MAGERRFIDEDPITDEDNTTFYPNSMKKGSNAMRFINAYNIIDQSLRSIYNYKRNLSFADVVRRTVPLNGVVRRYEDKLIDYARLRNSIVHNSNEDRVIAEPHIEVVVEMEHIAGLISSPPRVVDSIKKKDVKILDAHATVSDGIVALSVTGFKCIPIYDNNMLVGIIDSTQLVTVLGDVLRDGVNISKYCDQTPMINILDLNNKNKTYVICGETLTVQQALDAFYHNRKLLAIIITKHGTFAEKPVNILTNADLLDLNKVIDDYNI